MGLITFHRDTGRVKLRGTSENRLGDNCSLISQGTMLQLTLQVPDGNPAFSFHTLFYFFIYFVLETGSHYIVQAGL